LRARRNWALSSWMSSGGRPGRIILSPSRISARSSISSVSSGASSESTHGLRLAEPPDFASLAWQHLIEMMRRPSLAIKIDECASKAHA
jgi:hypothetical protein